MYKLLIVLAIQFCLPWVAYGLEMFVPLYREWNLSFLSVHINTVCLGSMIGLMRPRWQWMLLASGLTLCYFAIWQEVWWTKWQNAGFAVHELEIRWHYLKYLFQLFTVSFVLGILLSSFFELIYTREKTFVGWTWSWQVSLFEMLLCTALFAGLVVTATFQFQPTRLFDNFLGIFTQVDAICLFTSLVIFYLLLWRSWRGRRVALGLFCVVVSLFSILTDFDLLRFSQREQQFAHLSIMLIAIITVLLYRVIGLRIDWRRAEQMP